MGGVDQFANLTGARPPAQPQEQQQQRPAAQPAMHSSDTLSPARAGTDHNGFFTSSAAKALFKDYVRAIVTRVNSITGRANRDDPTIM